VREPASIHAPWDLVDEFIITRQDIGGAVGITPDILQASKIALSAEFAELTTTQKARRHL
jgi:hypothetical protein